MGLGQIGRHLSKFHTIMVEGEKNVRKSLFAVLLALALSVPPAFARKEYDQKDDSDESAAASKAEQAHQLAESDVIYQQQDFKAMYYQNVQIIALLKDIRASLEAIKARRAMDANEKTA